MPLHEYECDACGQRFEVIQKFSDPPRDTCAKCGKGPVRKLIAAPAFQLKGTGWYKTDYPKKDSDSKKDSSKDSGKDSGKDSNKESGKDSSKDTAASKSESGGKSDKPAAGSESTSTSSTTTPPASSKND